MTKHFLLSFKAPGYTVCMVRRSYSLLLMGTYRPLTVGVDGSHVSSADPHQAVQRSSFAVQTGAVTLDLAAAVQHDLRAQREILHQHPPVVQHLPLTLAADWTTCTAQDLIISDTIKP